jgi:hypothetical protein
VRSLLPLAITLAGLSGCEQPRFSSNPPPLAPESLAPASSSDVIDALFASRTSEAGAATVDSSHAMTITSCSSAPSPCPPPEADASTGASYHVVFGSGRGAIRSRGQAMADIYNEVRDRTALGQRLDAEPRGPGVASPKSTTQPNASSSDPIAECAFHLLDYVDGAGEVTLDVVHGSAFAGCMVSLGRAAGGSASQCLVKEPERQHRPGRGGM